MKKGDTIKYERKIQFKGAETITAKIVAVREVAPKIKEILLDNGEKINHLEI